MSTEALPKVEPRAIANDRIIFGPCIDRVTVDYNEQTVAPLAFKLGYELARTVDEPVSHQELIKAMYGWDLAKPDLALKYSLKRSVVLLRRTFGQELGDQTYGAIRTVQAVGYMALREFY